MKKIKIGVFGAYRGAIMVKYCLEAENAQVVAICDNSREIIDYHKNAHKDFKITFYDNFDEFINHDMDAVVLANYATEHAPFAIKAMKAGKHVLSEVLPCQTMKEAVELIETVEETGKIYSYGENFCYMPAPYEMRRLYKEGIIGEFEYGEGEYIHNCEPSWPRLTKGDKTHWRNNLYSTFYCTHSIGPIIHATGLRPVSVIGIEGTKNERNLRTGLRSGCFGMELITLSNGGVIKSLHGGLYIDSYWFSMYGSKGRVECDRDIPGNNRIRKVHLQYNDFSGDYGNQKISQYIPERDHDDSSDKFGHGGSDFYIMWHFVEKIKGNPKADIIDVYEAMDMFLPGMFAYRSILNGSKVTEIPNLRDKAEREKWRNDTSCTDPKVAGDMLLPTCKTGTPDIPDAIYDITKANWEKVKDEVYKKRLPGKK
ncbi:MAG: Gfo/Idh/MocA family oxidoreductase [Clostridia bacterium]|nr:Gfo/Idh/MocA family oxidoreductase [Clostridia bacterium]